MILFIALISFSSMLKGGVSIYHNICRSNNIEQLSIEERKCKHQAPKSCCKKQKVKPCCKGKTPLKNGFNQLCCTSELSVVLHADHFDKDEVKKLHPTSSFTTSTAFCLEKISKTRLPNLPIKDLPPEKSKLFILHESYLI